eukprot:CAMPEP_0181322762 /NCGR_PEP_ID=MMETSP1101-20121128/19404_1 /TAXON_ID=46948 /ORGANISM="Rhodomonas abbreviata, Strain Caron Lab Isolate" /LENGTH=279 /DNA_ID=CAMNT_0023430703 /DNA_START=13 /DNA_END=852 /DNA_ORIENTATION=-
MAAQELRSLSAVLAISALAAVLCVVLVSQSNLQSHTALVQKHRMQILSEQPGAKMIQYLKSDADVRKPLKPRMHALTMEQIMDANSQSVDDLGSEFGPVKRLAIGPDGLADEGSNSDIQLLNSLTREDAKEKDIMDAVDASHMTREQKLFSLGKAKHDMAYDAEKADRKGVMALGRAAEKQPSFKMVNGDDSEMADAKRHHSEFHALEIVQKDDGAEGSDDSSLAQVDLGDESEAEMMADPTHPMMQPKPQSKGIWVEPGSNKGYDSFALDSLQTHGEA